jgi:hypothetical protein
MSFNTLSIRTLDTQGIIRQQSTPIVPTILDSILTEDEQFYLSTEDAQFYLQLEEI